MNPRITFTCEGGPLNGRTVYHSLLPEDPSKPALLRMVTKAGRGDVLNEKGGDLETRGMYHLEERPIPPPFEVPPEPPEDAPFEVKQQMNQARANAEAVLAQCLKTRWIAVHDPSDQDKEWGPLEAPKVEEVKQEPEPKVAQRTVTIPDDLMVGRMKPNLKAIRELLDRRKEEDGRRQG